MCNYTFEFDKHVESRITLFASANARLVFLAIGFLAAILFLGLVALTAGKSHSENADNNKFEIEKAIEDYIKTSLLFRERFSTVVTVENCVLKIQKDYDRPCQTERNVHTQTTIAIDLTEVNAIATFRVKDMRSTKFKFSDRVRKGLEEAIEAGPQNSLEAMQSKAIGFRKFAHFCDGSQLIQIVDPYEFSLALTKNAKKLSDATENYRKNYCND